MFHWPHIFKCSKIYRGLWSNPNSLSIVEIFLFLSWNSKYMWVGILPCNPSAEVRTAQPAEHFHVVVRDRVRHPVKSNPLPPVTLPVLVPTHNKMTVDWCIKASSVSNTYATVSHPDAFHSGDPWWCCGLPRWRTMPESTAAISPAAPLPVLSTLPSCLSAFLGLPQLYCLDANDPAYDFACFLHTRASSR